MEPLTIRDQIDRVGHCITECERAQGDICPRCAGTLRPVLRSLDALYEHLCQHYAKARPPLAEMEIG